MHKCKRILGLVLLVEGCAIGETPGYGWVPPAAQEEVVEEEPGEPGTTSELAAMWSVDVEPGAHRVISVEKRSAIVLSASRQRVVATRFDQDGAKEWSTEVAQVSGGARLEVASFDGTTFVVAGTPADGGEHVAIVALDASGTMQWSRELVGDWGLVEVRGLAVHEDGAVAVLAEEFNDGRPVGTILEFYTADGGASAREEFSLPSKPRAIAADTTGFVALGEAPSGPDWPHNTWVRGYWPEGSLAFVEVFAIELTGVWLRDLDYVGHALWVGGVVNDTLSCVLPARTSDAEVDMKESPVPNPVAMTPNDEVVAIENGTVVLEDEAEHRLVFTPDRGVPKIVVGGTRDNDIVLVLSEETPGGPARLHRLPQ